VPQVMEEPNADPGAAYAGHVSRGRPGRKAGRIVLDVDSFDAPTALGCAQPIPRRVPVGRET